MNLDLSNTPLTIDFLPGQPGIIARFVNDKKRRLTNAPIPYRSQ
jgi:hypothetical protein